jgi:hypothetical protein
MNFEKCKQIEINGKVFDCEKPSWIEETPRLVVTVEGERYDMPFKFLEAIGAEPVLNIPKDGSPVWVKGIKSRKWQLMVATGKFNGSQIQTYPCTSEEPIEKFYMGWKYWKPFNPKELKNEGNK